MSTNLAHSTAKTTLRVSVVVPCSHKHARLLPELLDHLSRQTRRPDEVVVAVSGLRDPAVPALDGARVIWSGRPGTVEDQEFNQAVYERFRRTVITRLPLLLYQRDPSFA